MVSVGSIPTLDFKGGENSAGKVTQGACFILRVSNGRGALPLLAFPQKRDYVLVRMNNLHSILEELRKNICHCPTLHSCNCHVDPESAHIDADVLIQDAIKVLCDSNALDEETRTLLTEIVETYNDVPKWYS